MAARETWLDATISDSQLVDDAKFKLFRKDRNRFGGGVLVATLSDLRCQRRTELEHDGREATVVDSHHARGLLHLYAVYCPPNMKSEDYKLLNEPLLQMNTSTSPNTQMCVIGDFNSHVDWTDLASPLPSRPAYAFLLDIMKMHGLSQLCVEPSTSSS